MRSILTIALFSLTAFTTACDKQADASAHAGHDHGKDASCACNEGKKGGTVWCEKCKSGYIKGKKSKDKKAVESALAAK